MAKYYVIFRLNDPSRNQIVESWDDALANGAEATQTITKRYNNRADAEQAALDGYQNPNAHVFQVNNVTEAHATGLIVNGGTDYIATHVMAESHVGPMAYTIVDINNKIIKHHDFDYATVHVTAFIAIVQAFIYLDSINDPVTPVATTNVAAMAWIQKRDVNTMINRTTKTENMYRSLKTCMQWLNSHPDHNPVVKL